MGNTAANVTTGKPKIAGSIFRAPLGTALPTDAKTALANTYKCLGYISEDGVANGNALNSDTVRAWGGDPVLVTHKGREDTFEMTLIEATNSDVLGAIYNTSNVSGDLTAGITVKVTTEEAEEAVWVIDLILKNDIAKRIVIPDAALSDLGDITYNDSDPVGYDATISAMPIDGSTHTEYIIQTKAASGT